ncbi:Methyltransferase domain-containing protein [Devosia enhydra]|uniref:Methyltransferase domain-containing protein n=1 Tax=Devosia enhydra TaxID=665118 RepID=A0A1K2HUN3_9HYPH|nr:class I SAM-dependent methyltransferase [Devosia enhydra]SFZ81277.1 Methyltransferase domain-containing protein [Devosia enhydra]
MTAFWDEKFSRGGYYFGEAPNAFLASQKHRLPASGTALAIADGEGRNGVWLAEQGLAVTAIDSSSIGLGKAEDLARRRGVSITTELTDIADYGWPPERFDVVAGIFFQFAPPALRGAIFAGIKRTVKPGGLVLIEGYRPEQLAYRTGGPPQIEHLYTRELLMAAFGDFEILALSAHDSEIFEGSGHAGRSALIDLVARRPTLASG